MEPGSEFNFQSLPSHKFPSLAKTEVKESLTKWSMIDGLKLQAYSFDKPFKKYNERDFLVNFLGCQNVTTTLMKATSDHGFSPIGVPADVLKFSEVKCTLTTLEIFEKLKLGEKVVRQSGYIVKCMPHYIRASGSDNNEAAVPEGFEIEIADNLRKIILSNEDEEDDFLEINEGLLTDSDRKEFLFSLFSHFVIGGSLCQYEDNVEPYLMTTKLFYKDLIAVAAASSENADGTNANLRPDARDAGGDGDKDNRKLKIISHVYKMHAVFSDRIPAVKKNLLFNRNYLNNFLYVIVDPLKQICLTLYHHA